MESVRTVADQVSLVRLAPAMVDQFMEVGEREGVAWRVKVRAEAGQETLMWPWSAGWGVAVRGGRGALSSKAPESGLGSRPNPR